MLGEKPLVIEFTRTVYICKSCGERITRKNTELPPETCGLCGAVMFKRPAPEE